MPPLSSTYIQVSPSRQYAELRRLGEQTLCLRIKKMHVYEHLDSPIAHQQPGRWRQMANGYVTRGIDLVVVALSDTELRRWALARGAHNIEIVEREF